MRSQIIRTLALATGLVLVGGASQALAATQVNYIEGSSSSRLDLNDATNDDDVITVTLADGVFTVTDTGTGGATTADPDCTAVNATTVTCPFDAPDPAPPAAPKGPVDEIEVDLNNGTDSFTNSTNTSAVFVDLNDTNATGNKTVTSGPSEDQIDTGLGDDIVDTGGGISEIETNAGQDTVTTGSGEDDVDPGLGNDVVSTGAGMDDIDEEDGTPDGADTLDAGPGGQDEIDYDGVLPVTVTMNGQPDDGHAGEGDLLIGFEELFGAEGDDTIVGSDSDDELQGGNGNDAMSGGGGFDIINGSDGADVADGGGGNDVMDGQGINDGPDVYEGGAGGDRIEYGGFEGISITPDGQANDGRAGEGDNVSNIEGYEGGAGPDVLVGDDSSNQIEGALGDDTITGGGGDDDLAGNQGDDVFLALGGSDQIDCALGFDTAVHDAEDVLGGGCERRGASATADSAKANKKGKAKVAVSCPEDAVTACEGKLVLVSNGKTVAKGKYDIDAGDTKKVTAKLTKKGRKTLSKSKNELLVSAEARTEEAQGTSTNATELELYK